MGQAQCCKELWKHNCKLRKDLTPFDKSLGNFWIGYKMHTCDWQLPSAFFFVKWKLALLLFILFFSVIAFVWLTKWYLTTLCIHKWQYVMPIFFFLCKKRKSKLDCFPICELRTRKSTFWELSEYQQIVTITKVAYGKLGCLNGMAHKGLNLTKFWYIAYHNPVTITQYPAPHTQYQKPNIKSCDLENNLPIIGRSSSIPRERTIPLLSNLTECHKSSPRASPITMVFSVRPMWIWAYNLPFSVNVKR